MSVKVFIAIIDAKPPCVVHNKDGDGWKAHTKTTSDRKRKYTRAIRYCENSCPVLEKCEDYVLSAATNEVQGNIYAGLVFTTASHTRGYQRYRENCEIIKKRREERCLTSTTTDSSTSP